MSNMQWKALFATAAIGLSLGAGGIALADPVGANESDAAVAASGDNQCNGDLFACATLSHSQSSAEQTPPRHKVSAPYKASKPRRPAVAAHNEAFPVIVAYTLGTAAQSALNCKGENAWSLLCPGSALIGITY